jgi:RNA polymerase sigma-70 factor (ECF subfamily)
MNEVFVVSVTEDPACEPTGPDLAGAVVALRPKLHRYCARMTGSVIDAEDVVQDALTKALVALGEPAVIANIEGWIFRIVHNAALDFIRERTRQQKIFTSEDAPMVADGIDSVQQRQSAAAGLRTFMRLSATERSAVILMDVLGYSLEEIGDITDSTIPAIKAALHRGRGRLQTFVQEPDDRPMASLSGTERTRLLAYIDRFNARDFDAVRNMLAEDVHLDLVNKTRMRGAEVGRYFGNYAGLSNWHLCLGTVEGRPAAIVTDPATPGNPPRNFILLDWKRDRVCHIRDFHHARYAMEAADIVVLDRA